MGDDITPPEQAFNWVADTYGSTAEIKANGQVIVGLLHKNVGHLGIFVSGAVARKEHAQIVSVLGSIEALPPGLYGMNIIEHQSKDGTVSYNVEFVEHSLEEVSKRLNRFERKDEKAFEAVAAVSEFNQKAYELFAQPLVQQMSNETTAKLGRTFHPLRMQRWAISDLNPWLGWLAPAAAFVKKQRKAVGPENPLRQLENAGSGILSATMTYYRSVQDAISEAAFFQLFGHMFTNLMADRSPSSVTTVSSAEVAVAQREPPCGLVGRLDAGSGSVGPQLAHGVPRLADQTPPGVRVDGVGEGVGDRVQIGADVQTVDVGVVADVDDPGHVPVGDDLEQAPKEACRADASAQHGDTVVCGRHGRDPNALQRR